MPKAIYKFNKESLSYVKIEHSFIKKIVKLLPRIFAIVVGSVCLYIVFSYFIDSPKERLLRRENAFLTFQFEMIDKKIDQYRKVLEDVEYRDNNIYRVIFEADPISSSIRNSGIGGVNRYDELEGYENSKIVIGTAKNLDQIMKKLYVQSMSYDEVIKMAKNKKQMLASIPAIQPILNKELTCLASGFGIRYDPIYRDTKKMHTGIDFTAPTGTDIYATGDGVVESIEYSSRGYGNNVIIKHGYGYKTLYAHLHKISVKNGEKVKRGQIIGLVGNTGKSIGPHLHYEVRKNGRPINPINFFYQDLTPDEYDRMIELSSHLTKTMD